jgi:hypothetical protein
MVQRFQFACLGLGEGSEECLMPMSLLSLCSTLWDMFFPVVEPVRLVL